MKAVRILVADGYDAPRRSVHAVIGEYERWVWCGEAITAADAVAATFELKPDVVLLDLDLLFAMSDGPDAFFRLSHEAKVLVLSVYEFAGLDAYLRTAGAHGTLLKAHAGWLLPEAVGAVMNGNTFFHHPVAPMSAPTPDTRASDEHDAYGLTLREREVLSLLGKGDSNKEVARLLAISAKTVETHRARIMMKLGLHSITDVIRYAIRHRLVDV